MSVATAAILWMKSEISAFTDLDIIIQHEQSGAIDIHTTPVGDNESAHSTIKRKDFDQKLAGANPLRDWAESCAFLAQDVANAPEHMQSLPHPKTKPYFPLSELRFSLRRSQIRSYTLWLRLPIDADIPLVFVGRRLSADPTEIGKRLAAFMAFLSNLPGPFYIWNMMGPENDVLTIKAPEDERLHYLCYRFFFDHAGLFDGQPPQYDVNVMQILDRNPVYPDAGDSRLLASLISPKPDTL